MPEPTVQNLTPEALALLRRHNMLTALIRAETVAEAVGSEATPKNSVISSGTAISAITRLKTTSSWPAICSRSDWM